MGEIILVPRNTWKKLVFVNASRAANRKMLRATSAMSGIFPETKKCGRDDLDCQKIWEEEKSTEENNNNQRRQRPHPQVAA